MASVCATRTGWESVAKSQRVHTRATAMASALRVPVNATTCGRAKRASKGNTGAPKTAAVAAHVSKVQMEHTLANATSCL